MINKFYKLINEGNFIGVCTSYEFRRFQRKRKILLLCDESVGQYVSYNNTLYRDSWMCPLTTESIEYTKCDVIEISEEEYNTLHKAIENNENIVFEDEIIEDDDTENVENENTLDYVRSSKISEMRVACNKAITNGFDIVLSDNKSHHFSLSIYDQLNILSMKACDDSYVWYHADGEKTNIYSTEDIKLIYDMYMNIKTYHIAYFNAIKVYINSIDDISCISSIEYGMDIPEEFRPSILDVLGELFK